MTTKPEEIKTVKEPASKNCGVSNFMTKDPEFISPDMSIKEAASLMKRLNTGSLPVGDEKKLLGFITDRDIVIRAVAEALNSNTPVSEVMTDEVLYCYEDNELKAVADNMKDNEVLRLVVLDGNKEFQGIITHGQLAKAAIKNKDFELYEMVTKLACNNKLF